MLNIRDWWKRYRHIFIRKNPMSNYPLTPAVFDLMVIEARSVVGLSDRKLRLMIEEIRRYQEDTGLDDFRKIIEIEVTVWPKTKEFYQSMSEHDRELFWKKTDAIDLLCRMWQTPGRAVPGTDKSSLTNEV